MIEIKDRKRFVEACAAAFAWVSYSDRELTHTEVNRFIEMLNESPYVDEITDQDFEEAYLGLLDAFDSCYVDGVARAEARLEIFKDEPAMAQEILRYAKEAVYADLNVDDREIETVEEIKSLLGIS